MAVPSLATPAAGDLTDYLMAAEDWHLLTGAAYVRMFP